MLESEYILKHASKRSCKTGRGYKGGYLHNFFQDRLKPFGCLKDWCLIVKYPILFFFSNWTEWAVYLFLFLWSNTILNLSFYFKKYQCRSFFERLSKCLQWCWWELIDTAFSNIKSPISHQGGNWLCFIFYVPFHWKLNDLRNYFKISLHFHSGSFYTCRLIMTVLFFHCVHWGDQTIKLSDLTKWQLNPEKQVLTGERSSG